VLLLNSSGVSRLYFLFFLIFFHRAQAYPTYAVQHRITTCTACHISSTGGGIRNLDGKLYGARGYNLPAISKQQYVSGDWRYLFFKTEKPKTTKEGAGLMAAVVSANLPLQTDPDKTEVRLVFNQSLSGFARDQDTYLRFKLDEDTKNTLIQYINVGRVQTPFGIRTDEHRTYARMISKTSWNDYMVGVDIAANPIESLHYDLALLNGENGLTPDQLQENKTSQWGSIFNLRWTSPLNHWPIILGSSGLYVKRTAGQKDAWSDSFYLLASLGRWTKGTLPLTFSAELTQAKEFNGNNAELSSFVADSNYLQSVADSKAQAFFVQLDYDLSRQWVLTYKFDEMILDMSYMADYYRRHGLGVKYYFGPNLFVMARYEIAKATHPSEQENPKLGGQDAMWALVKAAF
jgi:hypothetical protein